MSHQFKSMTLQKFLLRGFILVILGIQAVGWASEVDEETYSQIPLKDAAPEINRQINQKIKSILQDINESMKHQPQMKQQPQRWSDSELELKFAEAWKSKQSSPWSSEFEDCIPSNNCAGWNKIERINLEVGESIFDEADFNLVTSGYIASVLNVCKVRMGVDKLTHMVQDGFRFYELWMDRRSNVTDLQVFDMSLQEENHVMGKTLTAVVSYGDVHANLAGMNLFRDLFFSGRYLERSEDGFLHLRQEIDICSYVSPFFDERQSPVQYFGEQAEILKTAIQNRRTNSKLLPEKEVQKILQRPKVRSVGAIEIAAGLWAIFGHPFLTSDIYYHFPSEVTPLENRRPVDLGKYRGSRESSYLDHFLKDCEASGKSEPACRQHLNPMASKESEETSSAL